MNKFTREDALIVFNLLCIKSNCYDENGRIIKANYIVTSGDDLTSAIYAAKLYFEIKQEYNFEPILLCIGDDRLDMSSSTSLDYICRALYVPYKSTRILKNSKNNDETISIITNFLKNQPTSKIIWSVTKVDSLALNFTQKKQAPQLKSFYYVIEESFDTCQKLFNGQRLLGGKLLLYKIASILSKCDLNADNYQSVLKFENNISALKAIRYLEKNFRLFMPKRSLQHYFKSVLQEAELKVAILYFKYKMNMDLEAYMLPIERKIQRTIKPS